MPFDEKTLVFTVHEKIYLMVDVDTCEFVNVKCDPDRAVELRERYEGIFPAYHCNKKHWNSVSLHQDVPPELIKELITHSYELVLASLPKKIRENI